MVSPQMPLRVVKHTVPKSNFIICNQKAKKKKGGVREVKWSEKKEKAEKCKTPQPFIDAGIGSPRVVEPPREHFIGKKKQAI